MAKVTKKGVTYLSSTGEVVDCLFCRIQNRQEPGTIVYEDSNFVVFKTIQPATKLHLLVTPRKHIKNVNSLKGSHGADIVRQLVDIGRKALGESADDAQYCFHIPPLNSINHLHLHAIASPASMGFWATQKYRQNTFFCQSADALIDKLSKQKCELTNSESPSAVSDLKEHVASSEDMVTSVAPPTQER